MPSSHFQHHLHGPHWDLLQSWGPASHASRGTVNLMECDRNDARDEAGDTDSYAVAATPVTAAQVWKAWVRAARYWLAVM